MSCIIDLRINYPQELLLAVTVSLGSAESTGHVTEGWAAKEVAMLILDKTTAHNPLNELCCWKFVLQSKTWTQPFNTRQPLNKQ